MESRSPSDVTCGNGRSCAKIAACHFVEEEAAIVNVGGGDDSISDHTTRAGAVGIGAAQCSRAAGFASNRVVDTTDGGGRGRSPVCGIQTVLTVARDIRRRERGESLRFAVAGSDKRFLGGIAAYWSRTFIDACYVACGKVTRDVDVHGGRRDSDLFQSAGNKFGSDIGHLEGGYGLKGVGALSGRGEIEERGDIMIDCNGFPSADGRECRVIKVGKRHSELDTSERNGGAVLGDREGACWEVSIQDRSVLQDLDSLSTGVGDGCCELELVKGGDTRGGTTEGDGEAISSLERRSEHADSR